jgi:hypothetical protein
MARPVCHHPNLSPRDGLKGERVQLRHEGLRIGGGSLRGPIRKEDLLCAWSQVIAVVALVVHSYEATVVVVYTQELLLGHST